MKSALITGAGTGIGRATAVQLAQDGFKLFLLGRSESTLNETLSALSGDGHQVITADVGNKSELKKAIASAISEQDNLTAVFANAGIGGENAYGEDDRWEQIIQTNLSGPYYTIMECLPYLRKSTSAYKNVLITSSCLSRFGVPNYTAYIASKSGVNGLTKALATDLAGEKILVNSILPGWVDTKMARDGIQMLADRMGRPFQEVFDEQMGFVPTGKMSQPEEIAGLVSYLFSDKQSSMTGQSIDINNGSFMI